jgi:hypothetical protein
MIVLSGMGRRAYPAAFDDCSILSDPDGGIEVGIIGTGNVTEMVAPVPLD